MSKWRQTNKLLVLTLLTVIIGLEVSRFCFYYWQVYPQISAGDWQSQNRRLAEAIGQARTQHPHVYTLGLDQLLYLWYLLLPDVDLATLPPSQNFQFATLDNINFNFDGKQPRPGDYLLGEKGALEQYLSESQLPYSVQDQWRENANEYLSVVLDR